MKSCQYLISFISECHQEASNASQVNSKFNLYLIMDSMLYRGFLNPMSDERGGGGGVDCTSCLENELQQCQF